MFAQFKTLSMLAAIEASMLVITDNAQAQCSGGGRGGGGPSQANLATGSFNPLVAYANTANSYAEQRQLALQQQQMLAMRQQMMMLQQQLYAVRQQQTQQLAQSHHEQQQTLQATRLARVEAKRAKRAERIAALKAKRDAERTGDDRGVMLTQATVPSSRVSVNQPNPLR